MANLLKNSMVMDMGNVFLLFNIYIYFPCNDFVCRFPVEIYYSNM